LELIRTTEAWASAVELAGQCAYIRSRSWNVRFLSAFSGRPNLSSNRKKRGKEIQGDDNTWQATVE
jgi:hypothetical protein